MSAKGEMLRVRLDERLFLAVKKAAKRNGQSASDYVRDGLRQKLLTVSDVAAPKTPSDVFTHAMMLIAEGAELLGTIGGMPDSAKAILDKFKGGKW
jgi:hypothetical protein